MAIFFLSVIKRNRMFKSRAEKHFSCFLFATELLFTRVCHLLYFLTAALGLKNIHIKETAFLITPRNTKEMSQKDKFENDFYFYFVFFSAYSSYLPHSFVALCGIMESSLPSNAI